MGAHPIRNYRHGKKSDAEKWHKKIITIIINRRRLAYLIRERERREIYPDLF